MISWHVEGVKIPVSNYMVNVYTPSFLSICEIKITVNRSANIFFVHLMDYLGTLRHTL